MGYDADVCGFVELCCIPGCNKFERIEPKRMRGMNRMHYIDFPNLGLHLKMNLELFSVGPFTVRWYGLITALAFLVIVTGVLRNSQKYGIKQDDLIDMMLITAPVGIVGARVLYVLVNWSYYAQRPSKIYRIWEGGLAIYGGIIFGIVTIYLFCRYRKISTLQMLDHLVVYLVLGQAVGRWGNFVNQELFGPNTNLPWAMTGDIIKSTIINEQYPGVNPDLPVHPLFLYESLWSLVTFFILLWFRNKKKLQGEVFYLYMVSYGLARFAIDSLRFDLKVGNTNINRIFGLLFAIAFIALLFVRRQRMKKNDEDDASYQPSQYREIITEIGLEPEEAAEAVEPEGTASDEQPEETAEEVEPEGTATDEQPEGAAEAVEPAETESTESTEQELDNLERETAEQNED